MRARPLSPHMSIYRMSRYSLLSSITNRITGVILSVGLLVLVYWLMAVASTNREYLRAHEILSSGFFKLIYAGLLIAFCYHLVAGVRHLVWDTGRGMEREQVKRNTRLVVAATVILVVILGYWLFLAAGRAS
jgi:succinate dehydrogenase / fumarate reductase, cytochrome b subunit